MKKEATEKIYCLGEINPNHISISDFSEYVNDQPLVLAKGPPPLSVREKKISKDEVVRRSVSRFNASCLIWCTSFLLLEYTKQPNALMSSHVYSKWSRIFEAAATFTDKSLPNASRQNSCFFAKFLPNPSREFSVGNVSVGPGWKHKTLCCNTVSCEFQYVTHIEEWKHVLHVVMHGWVRPPRVARFLLDIRSSTQGRI